MPLDRSIVVWSTGSLSVSWDSTRAMLYAFGSRSGADLDELAFVAESTGGVPRDRDALHSDTKSAAGGLSRPTLHGPCTCGIAGRALLHEVAGNNPGRLKKMTARFRAPDGAAR
jgi:MaoC like domain